MSLIEGLVGPATAVPVISLYNHCQLPSASFESWSSVLPGTIQLAVPLVPLTRRCSVYRPPRSRDGNWQSLRRRLMYYTWNDYSLPTCRWCWRSSRQHRWGKFGSRLDCVCDNADCVWRSLMKCKYIVYWIQVFSATFNEKERLIALTRQKRGKKKIKIRYARCSFPVVAVSYSNWGWQAIRVRWIWYILSVILRLHRRP